MSAAPPPPEPIAVYFKACMKGDLDLVKNKFELLTTPQIESIRDSTRASCLHYCARKGFVDKLDYFINEKKVSPALQTQIGTTFIHDAAFFGRLKVIKWAIENTELKLSCKDSNGSTVLHLAAKKDHKDLVEWILQNDKENIVKLQNYNGITSLHYAATIGSFNCVKLLQQAAPDTVDIQTNAGLTALYLAVQGNHTAVVSYLAKCQTNVYIKAKDNMSLLHVACQTGNLDVLKWLVESKKFDLNETDIEGATGLHFACTNGHTSIVAYLLHRNAKILCDNFGGTPLHDCSNANQIECARLLMSRRFDIDKLDNDSFSAYDIAEMKGFVELAKEIKRKSEDSKSSLIQTDVSVILPTSSPLITTKYPSYKTNTSNISKPSRNSRNSRKSSKDLEKSQSINVVDTDAAEVSMILKSLDEHLNDSESTVYVRKESITKIEKLPTHVEKNSENDYSQEIYENFEDDSFTVVEQPRKASLGTELENIKEDSSEELKVDFNPVTRSTQINNNQITVTSKITSVTTVETKTETVTPEEKNLDTVKSIMKFSNKNGHEVELPGTNYYDDCKDPNEIKLDTQESTVKPPSDQTTHPITDLPGTNLYDVRKDSNGKKDVGPIDLQTNLMKELLQKTTNRNLKSVESNKVNYVYTTDNKQVNHSLETKKIIELSQQRTTPQIPAWQQDLIKKRNNKDPNQENNKQNLQTNQTNKTFDWRAEYEEKQKLKIKKEEKKEDENK